MKIILCFLVLAGLVALICATPDDKADAAKAAADKAKKEAEDAAKKVKDATEAPAKAAKDIADDTKKAEKETEKEVEKGVKDCVKPHHGKRHPGIISDSIIAAEKFGVAVEDTFVNVLASGFRLFGL